MFTGVPAQVNERVSRMIKRRWLSKDAFQWTDSPPETPLNVQFKWIGCTTDTYPDERQ